MGHDPVLSENRYLSIRFICFQIMKNIGNAITMCMALKENLRRLRKKARLSQTRLSELSGLGQPQISDIENGKQLTTKQLPALAQALGCKISDLDEHYVEGGTIPSTPNGDGEHQPDRTDQLKDSDHIQVQIGDLRSFFHEAILDALPDDLPEEGRQEIAVVAADAAIVELKAQTASSVVLRLEGQPRKASGSPKPKSGDPS